MVSGIAAGENPEEGKSYLASFSSVLRAMSLTLPLPTLLLLLSILSWG